jgi:3-deoxy-D-manno-octulosonate 8-phosphate phosphatase (KDO 8-P phosphatase)
MSAPPDSPVHSNIDARFPQAMERATLDGHGIKLLAQAGVTPAIITGRQSEIVAWRAGELGIEHLYQGVADKREAFAHLLAATALLPADAGYMGDDWPDLPVIVQVGFAACPAQAHAEVRGRCHYVAQAAGGRGAVREVADLILKAQGAYDALLARALSAPDSP